MKNFLSKVRDTFVSGVIFLLPLLILFVLLSKIFQFLTGFTSKIAAVFGLKSFIGISGGTIVSAISLIILCLICGQLVRVSLFKSISKWADKQMMTHIPGYSVYREMAVSKLEHKEEALPYESAAWITVDDMQQPCFLMETMPDSRLVIFLPTAGNVKEGAIFLADAHKVQLNASTDMKDFKMAISNLGLGISKL